LYKYKRASPHFLFWEQQHTCHCITYDVSANTVYVPSFRVVTSCKMGGPETHISQWCLLNRCHA